MLVEKWNVVIQLWPDILVGGFNSFEKYESKWESSPGRGENKKYLKPPPSISGFFRPPNPGWSHEFFDRREDSCPTTRHKSAPVTRGYHLAPRFSRVFRHTGDGSEIRRSPVEVGSLSHHLQGFIWWWRISSIIHRIMVHQQIQSYLVDICKTSLSPKWN